MSRTSDDLECVDPRAGVGVTAAHDDLWRRYLLRGVTGFGAGPDGGHWGAILSEIHAWARAVSSKVIETRTPAQMGRCYGMVNVRSALGDVIHVLVHARYPFIAMAAGAREITNAPPCAFVFIDAPLDAASLLASAHIIDSVTLRAPFDVGTLRATSAHGLTEDEMRQLWYWNPKTLGEILFNFYD